MNEYVVEQLDDHEDKEENLQEVKGKCLKCKHKMHRDRCNHKKRHMTKTENGFETIVERCPCKQPSVTTMKTNQSTLF